MSKHPCAICQGACCESLVFPSSSYKPEKEFLRYRGRELENGMFEVESRCPKLKKCGSCGVYEIRPEVCKDYKVGGQNCIDTVMRRRDGVLRVEILTALQALSK